MKIIRKEVRNRQVGIRVTEDQHKKLTKIAKKNKCSISDLFTGFIRELTK